MFFLSEAAAPKQAGSKTLVAGQGRKTIKIRQKSFVCYGSGYRSRHQCCGAVPY